MTCLSRYKIKTLSMNKQMFSGPGGVFSKSIWLISIGNPMNASAYRNLWARVMFGECDLKTSKHQERPSRKARKSSCDSLFIIFSTIQRRRFSACNILWSIYSIIFLLILFNFLVDFPFCCSVLPNFHPCLCCFQSILVFSCSISLWFK